MGAAYVRARVVWRALRTAENWFFQARLGYGQTRIFSGPSCILNGPFDSPRPCEEGGRGRDDPHGGGGRMVATAVFRPAALLPAVFLGPFAFSARREG
jgi:hypothetical protein